MMRILGKGHWILLFCFLLTTSIASADEFAHYDFGNTKTQVIWADYKGSFLVVVQTKHRISGRHGWKTWWDTDFLFLNRGQLAAIYAWANSRNHKQHK